MPRANSDEDKRRNGTWKPSRSKELVEPAALEPMMPKSLPERAKEIWRARAPQLVEYGLLTHIDGDTFGVYCLLVMYFEECYEANEVPATDKIAQFRQLVNAFGLSPEGRLKVAKPAAGKEATGNPFQAVG